MATYHEVLTDFDSVFTTDAWKALGLPAFPANYMPSKTPDEFVKYEIIDGGKASKEFGEVNYKNGLFICEIYVKSDAGPRRMAVVADTLDGVLQRKQLNKTQTGSSNLRTMGADSNDISLYRADYSLTYNSY